MDLPKTASVVVIGGGVMGASTSYHLALRSCKDVVLLEREPYFGTQATGKCAGGIRYQFGTEINVRLSLLSLPMLERFEEETGQPIDLRWYGYLFLLTTDEEMSTFRRNVAMQHQLGVDTQWLTLEEIARKTALIRLHGIQAGTYYPREGLADPNGVVQGYVSAGRERGAQMFNRVIVERIEVDGGRVVGVATNRGHIATPAVVNAAGPWAGQVGRMAGLDVPVVPVRRQLLITGALPEVPPDFPFVIDFNQSLYFHREGEGILTGMSNPGEPEGFDQNVDGEWEGVHLEAAVDRMPLLERAQMINHWAGLYEVTPDAHPILGATPQLQGFYNVNGFSGHGFMHGPVCGLLLAEEILDGKAHTLDVSSLNLERFQTGELIVESNVV